jgi:hypothetical protein
VSIDFFVVLADVVNDLSTVVSAANKRHFAAGKRKAMQRSNVKGGKQNGLVRERP